MNRIRKHSVVLGWAVLVTALTATGASAQPVSHFIFGQAVNVFESVAAVEGTSTSAIPGVEIPDPGQETEIIVTGPLPGVTIEAYEVPSGTFLGRGRANREGFYNLTYDHLEVDHQVQFQIFLEFADGGREFVGTAAQDAAGDPIIVDNRLFSFELRVMNDEAVRAGSSLFSAGGEFVFLEIGNVDMDDIFDRQADPGDPSRWGQTKAPNPGHTLGPDLTFGRSVELYGLFGPPDGINDPRYYRIDYTGAGLPDPGPDTGSVGSRLWKKNYVIVGTSVEVHRTLLGPKDVMTLGGPLTGVYELDEALVGEPIPMAPGRFYSNYWTELGLRAIWNTATVADGKYELSLQAWDELGNPVPASANDFADLNLHVVNTPPLANIHNIQYRNGSIVLNDAAPCQTVVLNQITPDPSDDDLQFQVTADHPTGFLRRWQLFAWHGHNTPDGEIDGDTYPFVGVPPNNAIVPSGPTGIAWQSCAYRFRLHVWPRITNGYHIVYQRQDNWYAAINQLLPP